MDIIDQANDMAEVMLTAQRSKRIYSRLVPMGGCHYCDEPLPKVGQLFCNSECGEDFDHEDRLRKRSGKLE